MTNVNINSKEGSRVVCYLKNSEVLGLWFDEFDGLCKQLGKNWYVEVTYDVVKKAVVCDVYSDWFEDKFAGTGLSLTQTKKKLQGTADRANYLRKIYAEATEIAIQKGNGIFEILNLLDEIYGWEYDCGLKCGSKTFAHLKEKNRWVYFEHEMGYVNALDAITDDIVATKNLLVEEDQNDCNNHSKEK